ncbi:hypothetical protein H257_12808 [Aphanomyces astaci]|uniref:CNNM transmembrane domain-containing protein n=1 Tax=Aphanomyces astaci TaxID=112090 RepID=W4FZ87_APHAT|nr:hypothetical protein H257_12808 [Aphanomyces astaci]ETV71998.1 hypothetical protein H257_12808 [Aphanomyces astaci]|eukprot:XP_009838441.1 hypothetical protein H257_12808 [Aphanomyces astaci]
MSSTHCDDIELLTIACDPEGFFVCVLTIIGLIAVAGMMAGLTMGLLSLDQLNLQILQTSGADDEKVQAERLLPIVKKHHLLLVSLLLFNAAANEALPVFLSRVVTEAQAVMISVTCVLFFGEIIPSAIFTGKQQLAIAAALVPFVKLLMLVTFPIAFPIAKLLDRWLGEDHDFSRYKRKELKALVALHHKQSQKKWLRQSTRDLGTSTTALTPLLEDKPSSYGSVRRPPPPRLTLRSFSSSEDQDDKMPLEMTPTDAAAAPAVVPMYSPPPRPEYAAATPLYSMTGNYLHNDEVAIIHGAMDMSTKTVQMIMTPFDKVFMLDVEEKLCDTVMVRILASGYSRIPVYKGHRTNVVGLLLVKRLIVLNPAEEKPLKDLILRRPIVISPEHSCYSILNLFQEGRSHLALVTSQKEVVTGCWKANVDIDPSKVEILGVVTIEDVLEEIIMEEILDESDVPLRPPAELAREQGVQLAVQKFKGLLGRAKDRQEKDPDDVTREASSTKPASLVIDDDDIV